MNETDHTESRAALLPTGDVALERKYTHMADATARIVIQNALFWGRKKLSALTIPWCTYTDPQIAHVGLYVKDCQERGFRLKTFTVPMSDVDRAVRRRRERLRQDPRPRRHRHHPDSIPEINQQPLSGLVQMNGARTDGMPQAEIGRAHV